MRWKGQRGARVVKWESSEVARQEVPVFIQGWGGRRVSPRFHLFVSGVNQ